MSRQINQPINQVKLTNVAVVRCHKDGTRFEIACYRNKVMDYRAGLETDLSEVLQTDRIFTNVSKGQFAKAVDLEKAFGTRDQEEIAKYILDQSPKQQSDFQVSDLERAQVLKDTLSQIATWVSQNCVHADGSDRPFPTSQIKDALGKNYIVHPHKPIKKQCLDAVKYLKTIIPIERAKMELQLQYASNQHEIVRVWLEAKRHQLVNLISSDSVYTAVVRVDPSLYRELSELMNTVNGTLEILEQVFMSHQGDIDLEVELEMHGRKQQEEQNSQFANGNQSLWNSEPVLDDEDSDVEELVARLQALRQVPEVFDLNEKDFNEDKGETADAVGLTGRKASTKNNRKKSKKQKRAEKDGVNERQRIANEGRYRQQEQQQSNNDSGQVETKKASVVDIRTEPPRQSQEEKDGGKSCNTCGGSFANGAAYRAHFRSDWHRFNQKLKIKGVPPVSEEEFLLCDADTFFGSSG